MRKKGVYSERGPNEGAGAGGRLNTYEHNVKENLVCEVPQYKTHT